MFKAQCKTYSFFTSHISITFANRNLISYISFIFGFIQTFHRNAFVKYYFKKRKEQCTFLPLSPECLRELSSFSITSTTKKKFGHPWSSLLSVCLSACPPLSCLLLLSTQLSPKGLCCIAPHKKVILQCLCLVLFVTIHHPSIHLADHNALS